MKNVVGFAFLIISSIAQSEDWHVYGDGNDSCGMWLEDRKTENHWFEKGQWVLGFLGGAGYVGASLRETDAMAVVGWLDRYCAEHPLKRMVDAAIDLTSELTERDSYNSPRSK